MRLVMSAQKQNVALARRSAERPKPTQGRFDRTTPKGAQRYAGCYTHLDRMCVVLLTLVVLLGALQLLMLVVRGRGLDGIPPVWPMISIAALLLVAARVMIQYLVARTLQKRIGDEHFKVCLECGYPLTGLLSVGRCPECGAYYNIAETQEYWTSWLFRRS
jgi:hypothetical protein